MSRDNQVDRLRHQIDEGDKTILDLLNKRGELAISIGNLKKGSGMAPYAPAREADLLNRLRAMNKGPFPDKALVAVYREIMSACLALQKPLRVAYLGPEGTFTHQASLSRFGSSAQYIPQATIGQVFAEVEKGGCDLGVAPVENSTEGSVTDTLDLLIETPLTVCGEIFKEVSLDLLSKGGRLKEIKKIYSHPQALAQCRRWLEANLPDIPAVKVESTALAARAARRDGRVAAIASEYAGSIYGLKVVKRSIQDSANNMTRFLVIGKEMPGRTGYDKTSLLFSVRHEPGALVRALRPFARRRLNLSKIESRPLKGKTWEYLFFLDLEGHISDRKVGKALEELKGLCLYMKVLGSYPRA